MKSNKIVFVLCIGLMFGLSSEVTASSSFQAAKELFKSGKQIFSNNAWEIAAFTMPILIIGFLEQYHKKMGHYPRLNDVQNLSLSDLRNLLSGIKTKTKAKDLPFIKEMMEGMEGQKNIYDMAKNVLNGEELTEDQIEDLRKVSKFKKPYFPSDSLQTLSKKLGAIEDGYIKDKENVFVNLVQEKGKTGNILALFYILIQRYCIYYNNLEEIKDLDEFIFAIIENDQLENFFEDYKADFRENSLTLSPLEKKKYVLVTLLNIFYVIKFHFEGNIKNNC